jgi:hypothetical protein
MKRYDMKSTVTGIVEYTEMIEIENGDYIRYSDYELEKAASAGLLNDITNDLKVLLKQIDDLLPEVTFDTFRAMPVSVQERLTDISVLGYKLTEKLKTNNI